MDENPYKSPEEPAVSGLDRRFIRQLALVLLLLIAYAAFHILAAVCLKVLILAEQNDIDGILPALSFLNMRTTAITLAVLILLASVYVLSYCPVRLVVLHWVCAEGEFNKERAAWLVPPLDLFYGPAEIAYRRFPPLWRLESWSRRFDPEACRDLEREPLQP